MARTGNKRKLVEELFTFSDIDLIAGAATLIMQDRFSIRDVLKYLGKKRHKLINGFSLIPFDARLLNITVQFLDDRKNTITQLTFGGKIEYSLEALVKRFGPYTAVYGHRDGYTLFVFKELPIEVNAVELHFSDYDLVFDKATKEFYEIKNGKKNVISPKNIRFNHFTLLF